MHNPKNKRPPTSISLSNYKRETRSVPFFIDFSLFYLLIKTISLSVVLILKASITFKFPIVTAKFDN